jgi:ribosomal protein S18 acetylase RimI-like enzyme
MISPIIYRSNEASEAEVAAHLYRCDADFMPPLSNRIEIDNYAAKIVSNANRLEAWADGNLIGLVAIYCNDQKDFLAHITNVSVQKEWAGKGVGSSLTQQAIEFAKKSGAKKICLEVDCNNTQAIALYKKIGFTSEKVSGSDICMNLELDNRKI